jgi:O-antigen ligase
MSSMVDSLGGKEKSLGYLGPVNSSRGPNGVSSERAAPATRRLETIQRWWLRAGAFVLPLAFWWDTYDHYVLPKLLVARVLIFGLLILLVLRTIADGALVLKRTALDVPLFLFLASAIASTLFAENQNVAIFGTYSRFDGLLTILTYTALFWLTAQALDGPADARGLLRVLLVSGYLVAAIAIVQAVTDTQRYGVAAPAFGTLGQQNVLGAFLVMLAPVAYREVIDAAGWGRRILALNALAMILVCLILTLSRSSWLAAALVLLVVLAATRHRLARIALAAAGVAAVGLLVLAGAAAVGLEHSIAARALTIFDPSSWNPRPQIWRDTLHLIASRPLLGYGPDNFGLVYPRFQADFLGTVQVDKAHAESLQVAATQGLVGLAAYLLVLGAFVRAFWQGRRAEGAAFLFAGWLGYEVVLQLNFSALAASLPFWMFAAAALETWGASQVAIIRALPKQRWFPVAAGVGMAACVVALIASTVPAFLADAHLLRAVNADFAGSREGARPEAALARELAPQESVYAVEVGNVAFESGDWAAARAAYGEAARLGTYDPFVYRNLALADRYLGLTSDGLQAARKAVELDRFDPANQALLAGFLVGAP